MATQEELNREKRKPGLPAIPGIGAGIDIATVPGLKAGTRYADAIAAARGTRAAPQLANVPGQPYRDPRTSFSRPMDGNAEVSRSATAVQRTQPKQPSQPLDAQAASDRASMGAAWDTVKDLNRRAGSAIADVATLPLRGVTGAYDSAVVRPMRAAGIDAAYLGSKLVPNGVNVNSMTPFYDQIRAGDAAPVPAQAGTPQTTTVPTQRAAAAATPPQAATIADAPVSAVAANPAPAATPGAAPARTATQQTRAPRSAAPGRVARARPAAATAAPGIGTLPAPKGEVNPMNGVAYTALGGVEGGAIAAMNNGTQVQGQDALNIMSQANGYFTRKPVENTPVEVIRGPRQTTDARGNVVVQDGSRSMAVPELGYGEMDAAGYEALRSNGGIGQYTQAIAQGQVDNAAPEQAKQDTQLAVQSLQNQGSATNAGISAGPGYASVRQRADEAKMDIEFKRDQAGKPIAVGGGQEPVYDNASMYIGMRTVPGRLYNPKDQKWVDQPAADSTSTASKYEVGAVYTDAKGNKATWNGTKFVPVR